MRVPTIARVMCSATLAVALAASAAPPSDTEVQALEAKCEQAREAQLKPLREAEIARCKNDKRSDPEYCERYWRDLGNATRRPNGTVKPRMFNDLPECIAAREARWELQRQ
jgi:hypothetical protein